jgi:DNA-binding IclR family transcriptional regulator
MAARIAPVDQLRTVARPLLTDLRDETGETANLLVRGGTSVIYLDEVESRHTLRHSGCTRRPEPPCAARPNRRSSGMRSSRV